MSSSRECPQTLRCSSHHNSILFSPNRSPLPLLKPPPRMIWRKSASSRRVMLQLSTSFAPQTTAKRTMPISHSGSLRPGIRHSVPLRFWSLN